MEPKGVERWIAAILCADVVGYSRLMGEDEEATLLTLNLYRQVIDGLVASQRQRRAFANDLTEPLAPTRLYRMIRGMARM